jgi:pimeloyl-ACP methyl ester carboxylesterase
VSQGAVAPEAATARSYVLVHGAWHGGWCWSRVEPLLRAAGHRVFAPTLTGLGDRAHLFGGQVTLATHVEDVLALIDTEELDGELVLVGHSYGGNVITGVADVLRERIAHCVFLDAVVPPSGATRWSWSAFNSPADRQARLGAVRESGAGVALPAPAPQAFAVTEAQDVRWLERRLRPMPVGTYVGEIVLRHGGSDGLARTYVAADAPAYRPMMPVYDRVRSDPSWRWQTIATGHDMMVTAPEALAALLLAVRTAA